MVSSANKKRRMSKGRIPGWAATWHKMSRICTANDWLLFGICLACVLLLSCGCVLLVSRLTARCPVDVPNGGRGRNLGQDRRTRRYLVQTVPNSSSPSLLGSIRIAPSRGRFSRARKSVRKTGAQKAIAAGIALAMGDGNAMKGASATTASSPSDAVRRPR